MTAGVLGMVVGGGQGSEAGKDRSCLPPNAADQPTGRKRFC